MILGFTPWEIIGWALAGFLTWVVIETIRNYYEGGRNGRVQARTKEELMRKWRDESVN